MCPPEPTHPSAPAALAEAVVICTRNRPIDLKQTLSTVAPQAEGLLLVVVDASDPEARAQNHTTLEAYGPGAWHLIFPGVPSLARQRNYAVSMLPPSVEWVHFVDDDVTALPGYVRHLSDVLRSDPEIGGVSGMLLEDEPVNDPAVRRMLRYLFLLDHPQPGRVLPSGRTSGYSAPGRSDCFRTRWLSGCSSSYRRSLLAEHPTDERLEGYSFLEDLDVSYRIGRVRRLVAVPQARLIHHQSPKNRHDPERSAADEVVHRYWFVRKNIRPRLLHLCFWWSLLGEYLAILTSRHPRRHEALAGFRAGLRRILSRKEALLRPTDP